MLEVLPYSSVGGKGRETWEVETEAEATVAQVEEASGTAVSKVVGTSAAIWDVTKSSSIFTLFLNSLFSAWHSFISFSNVHRRQVSEMNLNCCGANLPWQLVHFLNDEGILVLIFV